MAARGRPSLRAAVTGHGTLPPCHRLATCPLAAPHALPRLSCSPPFPRPFHSVWARSQVCSARAPGLSAPAYGPAASDSQSTCPVCCSAVECDVRAGSVCVRRMGSVPNLYYYLVHVFFESCGGISGAVNKIISGAVNKITPRSSAAGASLSTSQTSAGQLQVLRKCS